LIWLPVILLLVLVMIPIYILPSLVRDELQAFLIEQGVQQVHYKNISLNLFTRELGFTDLRLQRKDVQDLYVPQAKLQISLIPLWQRKIIINKLRIQGSQINTKLDARGNWEVAGLKLPIQVDKSTTNEQEWDIQLNALTLEDTKLNVTTPELKAGVTFISAGFSNESKRTGTAARKKRQYWQYKLKADLELDLTSENLSLKTRLTSAGAWPYKDSGGINAKATLNDLILTNSKSRLGILRSTDISLDGVHLAEDSLSIEEAVIKNADIGDLGRVKESSPPFAQLSQTRIKALQWIPGKHLGMDRVILESPRISANRLKNGQWEIATILAQGSGTQTRKNTGAGTGKSVRPTALALSIKVIELESAAEIRINDHTVSPAVKTDLLIKKCKLESMDTSRPDNKSPLKLNGSINKYGQIEMNGNVQLFSPKISYDLSIRINSLDLPPLSSYVTPATGYQITNGHMDLKAAISTTDGKIKGNSKLTFEKLKTTPKDKATVKKFTARLTMPLESILLLLEDKKDKIHLDVPISGDADDPKLGFDDVLNKAVVSALRTASLSYLKYYFLPYGALVTMVQIGEKVFKLRLDPVIFSPGETALNDKSIGHLKHVAVLMIDKKKLDLSICAKIVKADEGHGSDQTNVLARTRSDNVRDYLVKELGIDPRRLYVCQPESDSSPDALPRVELEF